MLNYFYFPSHLQGPALPEESVGMRSHNIVSNENSLYYINTLSNTFLKLVCSETIEDCDWQQLEQTLKHPRGGAVALMLPDDMVDMVDCA